MYFSVYISVFAEPRSAQLAIRSRNYLTTWLTTVQYCTLCCVTDTDVTSTNKTNSTSFNLSIKADLLLPLSL